MRISGNTIPDEKRIEIALTYLYGIGRSNVKVVLEKAKIDGSIRTKNLSEDEVKRITQALETYKVEGDLRAEVGGNIRRLRDMGTYRGTRHAKNLPVRGQRTRSNGRTKRGKRVTIGAIKKELAAKMEAASTAKSKPAALRLKPKAIIPIHDWHWKDEVRKEIYRRLNTFFSRKGITFYQMETGQPQQIDLGNFQNK